MTKETTPTPPPEKTSEATRKSIKWEVNESSDSGSSLPNRLPHFKQSYHRSHLKRRKSWSSTKSTGSVGYLSYYGRKLACCDCREPSGSDFSDKNDDIDSLCKKGDEEEIIARLQHAVNELGHRPTSYEIESEILRWQKLLEIEQYNYEQHGKPKFKYKWFRRNKYLMIKRHPLYATKYENQRKLETRIEEFRFGVSTSEDATDILDEIKTKNSYMAHAHLTYYEEAMHHGSGFWSNDKHVFLANLALITSVGNFIRFPQICYVNGGFTFLVTYYLLLALVGQPLLYFEMLIGQFSLNGPAGFGQLHPWARGIPYAIGFVCVTFGIAKNIYLSYTSLYFFIAFISDPGECKQWSWEYATKCFPYDRLEEDRKLLQDERLNKDFNKINVSELSVFSVDLFFREVMLDEEWQNSDNFSHFHWKLMASYSFVIFFAFFMLRNSLTGRIVQKYLKYTFLIPIIIFVLLLHQAFTRGAFDTAVAYLMTIDTEHIYVLSIWGKAFEMVLSTLGIGYGFHWSISGKARFDYRGAYDTSWRICGYAALFTLLSSLVLYLEIGIVGEVITGSPNQYHVFFERLGVSFVSYTGALIKVGVNTPLFVVLFFGILTIFGMWSQIIAIEVLFRWIDQGYIVKGHPHHHFRRKWTTILIIVIIQLFIISPHFFQLGGPVLAHDNIFEGYFAAYGVLLAELFTIVYLYGFGRFLVDIEIMTKRKMSALFQIQIRYIVIPTIALFMLLMTIDAFTEPTLYTDRKDIGSIIYFGVFANLFPVIIIIFFAQFNWILMKFKAPTNKVNPEPFRYVRSSNSTFPNRIYRSEQRFVAKKTAPSQSRGGTIRSEVYQDLVEDMHGIYDAQLKVRDKFLGLLRFKRNQVKWLSLLFGVLGRKKIKSMHALLRRVMLGRRFSNDRVDIRFLRHSVKQFIHLPIYASQRKISLVPKQDLYKHLVNELMKATAFHLENYNTDSESSSGSSDDISYSTVSESPSVTISHYDMKEEELDPKYLHLHRHLIGKIDKPEEELRTLLEIRIKRGLEVPYDHELEILTFLRRMRAKHEREQALWNVNVPLPIEYFIPASISHHGKKVAFTIFHAVVLEGNDHYVLKRLPVPRPTIARITRRFLDELPGRTVAEKISQLVTKKMLANARQIMNERNLKDWSGEQVHQELRKVIDMLDEDVYNLDYLLTCVVVIVPEESKWARKKQNRQFLIPPTRRRKTYRPGGSRRKAHLFSLSEFTDYAINAYKEMSHQDIQEAKWNKLLDKAPDIIFHSYSSDDSDIEIWAPDEIRSSSGSQSTFSPDEDNLRNSIASKGSSHSSRSSSVSSAGSLLKFGRHVGRSRFLLENESLQKRDRKSLVLGGGKTGEADFRAGLKLPRVDPKKLRHLSARRWKRLHRIEPQWKFSKVDDKLQHAVDEEARKRGDLPMVLSRSCELLDVLDSNEGIRKAISFASLRDILRDDDNDDGEVSKSLSKDKAMGASDESKANAVVEQKLANVKTELMYVSLGRILVVDHAINAVTATSSSNMVHKTLTHKRFATPDVIEVL